MKTKTKKQTESVPKVDSIPTVENKVVTIDRKHHNEGPDISGAFMLIGIGVIFLLINLGYLDISIWTILWRFWPVFLILGGLQLIFGKGTIGRLIVGFVSLFVVAGIIGFALMLNNPELRNRVNQQLPGFENYFERIKEVKKD
jgi:hypothetical protein